MEEREREARRENVRSAAMEAESGIAEAKSSLRGLLLCLDLYDVALQSGEGLDLYDILHFNSMQVEVLRSVIDRIDEACEILEAVSSPEPLKKDRLACASA